MNQQPNREKVIFLEAKKTRTAQARSAFLDRACGDDPALRQRVEELLNSSDDAGSFLNGAAVGQVSNLGALDREAAGMVPALNTGPFTEGPGTVIGPYKLMEQIGEGGFGLVFVAKQIEPVRRRVALKLIKPGMDSRDVIGRFEAERQALALMEHPNIARVLDAGTTESGRPYFVMELVRGIPITDYCDQSQLTPGERLELFVSVCRAIQHAHQKGIIHRDVKPSNVLVTLHDGEPVVKVIDFGVAKALNQQLARRTVYTQFTQMIGTPLYMSPEQAEMSGLDVDTRSDIYALGVLLYELLTGSTPFDRKRLSKAAYDEIRRIIREESPPKPSTRLSKSGNRLPTLAAQRKTEPARLSKMIRGDLDWIVMKALEKDRNRRYETANGLAADIRRYLGDEAVIACPPTASYRLRKFARRHKAALVTYTLVAASLVAGTILSTLQAVRAIRAETRAERSATSERESAAAARESAYTARTEAARARASENELRAQVYASDMNIVGEAYTDGLISRMSGLLEKHLPGPRETDQRGLEWYHWWRAGHLERTMARHPLTASFDRLAVSPDGKTLALVGWPRHLYLYDSESLCLIRAPLQIDTHENCELRFSADGSFLVVGEYFESGEGTRIIETKSWETVATVPVGVRAAVAFATEKPLLAVGGWDVQLFSRSDSSWEVIGTWNDIRGVVSDLEFTPDGETLIVKTTYSIQGNQRIEVWDVQQGAMIRELGFGDTQAIRDIAMSPGGSYLAVGESDGDVHLWGSKSFSAGGSSLPFKTLTSSAQITSIDFSPDETKLVAGTEEANNFIVWDILGDGSDPLFTVHAHSRQVSDLEFGKDSNVVYSASDDGYLKVWDLARCQPYDTVRGVDPPSHIGYADENTIVYHDRDGIIQRRDVAAARLLTPLDQQSKYDRVAVSDDGGYLAGLTHNDELRIWDLASRRKVHEMPEITGNDCRLAVSRDGRRVAYITNIPGPETGQYGDICLIDLKRKTIQTGGELQERVILRARPAFAPDSKHLVIQRAGREKFNSLLLDLGADPIKQRYQLSGWGPEECATFSRDGSTLAIGSYNYDIRLHDTATGELKHTLHGHTDRPRCLAFTQDGSRLVSAGDDGTVRIWKIADRECRLVSTLRGHSGNVLGVAVSPEGSSIASVSEDGTLLVWRTASQGEVERFVHGADPTPADQLKKLTQRARQNHAAGDWHAAIADYTSALELAPANQYFLQLRADALAQTGRRGASLDDWTRLVQLTHGKNADYLYRRGDCFLSLDRRADAGVDFARASTLTSGVPWRLRQILRRVESALGLGEPIVPNGAAWRYSTSPPPESWHQAPDDSSSWQVGAAPFGTGNRAKTSWANSSDIWLQKSFELDRKIGSPLAVRVLADDQADIYINGTLAGRVSGNPKNYVTVECSADIHLRQGKNLIAVHGRDAGWDAAAVDVGLYVRGDRTAFESMLASLEQPSEVLREWSDLLVIRRRWEAAAAVFGKLVALDTPDEPAEALTIMQAAILYAYTDNLDDLHQLSTVALERFGETDVPEVAERVAKVCLLVRQQEAHLLAASKLADKALAAYSNYGNGTFLPWAQLIKALAEYRKGNLDAASVWVDKCLSSSADIPVRTAQALAVSALAKGQRGDRDAARERIAKITSILQEHSSLHTNGVLPGNWHDWLLCEIFLHETKSQ